MTRDCAIPSTLADAAQQAEARKEAALDRLVATKEATLIDYDSAAGKLGVSAQALKAVGQVESSGRAFWTIDGKQKPVIRLEAHWFGKLTGYRYNDSHPHISVRQWTPSLAARGPVEAWQQFDEAAGLDEGAAIQATSWGGFQLMGFHWKNLGYGSPQEMRVDMATEQGQLDAFVRFIKADPVLLDSLQRQDWRTFAGRYNGPGQIDVYASKMADSFARAA